MIESVNFVIVTFFKSIPSRPDSPRNLHNLSLPHLIYIHAKKNRAAEHPKPNKTAFPFRNNPQVVAQPPKQHEPNIPNMDIKLPNTTFPYHPSLFPYPFSPNSGGGDFLIQVPSPTTILPDNLTLSLCQKLSAKNLILRHHRRCIQTKVRCISLKLFKLKQTF